MIRKHLLTVTITGMCLLPAPARAQDRPNPFPILGSAQAAPVARLPEAVDSAATAVRSPHNQRIADAIAARLRDSGQLRHYTIDIRVLNGTAMLYGRVASEEQRQAAVNLARTVAGIASVREQLQVAGSLVPAQALDALQMPEVGPIPQPMINQMDIQPPAAMPPAGTYPVLGGNAGTQEPEPIYKAANPDPTIQPPLMPPYAWPTYAPYNNYSRVAYPTQYPYEAWPFIGPFYPFPKVPPGWRKITLSWEDGYWWYSRNASGHDWWRIRYW